MKKLIVLQLTAFIALFALSTFAHAHGATQLNSSSPSFAVLESQA